VPPIPLTRDLPDTGRSALDAIAATGAQAVASHVVPDRALLGRLGLLTNGSLDRTWTTRDGRVHHYRTAGGTELADLGAGSTTTPPSTTACACCAQETTAPR
jgi:hypothetical protein